MAKSRRLAKRACNPSGDVTEVIFSRIKPGMEDAYREWTTRIEAAQARYPGYRGMFLQPPDEKGGMWTTIIRFKSAPQLEAWMNAPERKSLLQESKAFIEHEQLTRLATAFPGWVPVDPLTGKGPPNWKTAMLVLLGLFPVVMLELRFLSPILTALGTPRVTCDIHREFPERRRHELYYHAAVRPLVRLVAFPRRRFDIRASRRKAWPFSSFFSRSKSLRFGNSCPGKKFQSLPSRTHKPHNPTPMKTQLHHPRRSRDSRWPALHHPMPPIQRCPTF